MRYLFLFTALATTLACATRTPPAETLPTPAQSDSAAVVQARRDSMRLPYTEADIHFMTGMIGHHAQAVTMAQMAERNGASDEIRRLSARIVNAQEDEIRLMQTWLRDRRLPVPEASAGHADAHAHHAMMPGMLTAEQLKQLEAARGEKFDELFLTLMIQHHQGAVDMVKQLLASHGAAQDLTVFRLASDVNAEQTTEIERMQRMLLAIKLKGGGR